MVVGLIAGGLTAPPGLLKALEDDPNAGVSDIASLDVGKDDLVVGIATSGRTPYVLGAVARLDIAVCKYHRACL